MPMVSIIMSVYNCADTLQSAIDSIIEQTFTDWELIICDDCSDDNTPDLLKIYESMYPQKIIVIRNEKNSKLAFSLNQCLIHAKGKYIARMDADDISYSNRLQEEVSFLEGSETYDFVGCNADLFDRYGVWGEIKHIEYPQKRDFLYGSRFIHPTIMMRKNVYDSLGGYRVSKETIRGQDYDLFMRAYALNYKGYNIQKKLFGYREDKETYKKRTYKHRINESIVRYKGFKMMNVMPIGYIYVLKPLIVGLIPSSLLRLTRKIKKQT